MAAGTSNSTLPPRAAGASGFYPIAALSADHLRALKNIGIKSNIFTLSLYQFVVSHLLLS